MRSFTGFLLALSLTLAWAAAQTRTSKGLDIHVVDVEGGNATLLGTFTITNARNSFSKTYKAKS